MKKHFFCLLVLAAMICLCLCLFQDKNVYVEDWGEGLAGKSAPVLCVADLSKGEVTICTGVPPHVSPGQVSLYC